MTRRTFIQALAFAASAPALAAEAQPAGKSWRIGWLTQASEEGGREVLIAFREGLRLLGYADERHYRLEARYAGGRTDRLPGFAAELTTLPVDVIVANTTPAAFAAMQATRTIPIVTVGVGDPVGSGLVRSLARPGGNVTGPAMGLEEVSQKWLELLRSLRRRLSRVAVFQNSTNRSMSVMLGPLEESARALNVTLLVHDLTPADKPASVFRAVAGAHPDGLVVLPDALLFDQRAVIFELAARLRLPAIYGQRRYVLAGGLLSYGPDPSDYARRAAAYVDKILKGAKPADLPVERPTKFELVVNMKTARGLGLTIPPSLLIQAEQVLE